MFKKIKSLMSLSSNKSSLDNNPGSIVRKNHPSARIQVAIAIYSERYINAGTSPSIFWNDCLTQIERRTCRQIAEGIRMAPEL